MTIGGSKAIDDLLASRGVLDERAKRGFLDRLAEGIAFDREQVAREAVERTLDGSWLWEGNGKA
jgi:hypothetical protein